jgi:hypothetical protein
MVRNKANIIVQDKEVYQLNQKKQSNNDIDIDGDSNS